MNKREITSGNKIIAKFLGFKITKQNNCIEISAHDNKIPFNEYFKRLNNGYRQGSWENFDELEFHKSWDWLMRACYVFDNIFDSDSDSKTIDDLQIYPIEYSQHCDNIDHLVGCYELEPVYNALIEAIKWYNTYTKK
jgi:hypothetical protein